MNRQLVIFGLLALLVLGAQASPLPAGLPGVGGIMDTATAVAGGALGTATGAAGGALGAATGAAGGVAGAAQDVLTVDVNANLNGLLTAVGLLLTSLGR